MRFDYKYYEGEYLPIVSIMLKGPNGSIRSRAYVDSGASYSIFHADVAEILGLRLEDGELREMTVGDGNILKVYIHNLSVSISEIDFTASIGFSKGIGTGFNIIGRKTIFDKFIVSFHEKDKYLEFTQLP